MSTESGIVNTSLVILDVPIIHRYFSEIIALLPASIRVGGIARGHQLYPCYPEQRQPPKFNKSRQNHGGSID
jgi:hypothetical protein